MLLIIGTSDTYSIMETASAGPGSVMLSMKDRRGLMPGCDEGKGMRDAAGNLGLRGSDLAAPKLIQARFRDRRVEPEQSYSYIRQRVMEGQVVILKSAFSSSLMLQLRGA